MLSYVLAIAVAISSLILFSTAFLMSKIHRKDDFLWSAVGLFYALILWFCARNITGTVLLGQAAATVLIISYCWQTIKLRRVIANPALAAETNNFSVVNKINSLLKRKPKLESPAAPVVKPPTPKVTEQEIAIPETPAETPAETPVQTEAPATLKEPVAGDYAPRTPQDPVVSQPEIEPTQKQDNVGVTESQPLPNKLPEPIAQPQKAKPQSEATAQPVEQVDNLVTETAEAVNPNPQTADTAKEQIDTVTQPQAELTPEVVTPEVKVESSLDALEVVEVAEVLEAETDNITNQRESERDSIIEVTTTEINIVTETQKIDRNQNDSDPQGN